MRRAEWFVGAVAVAILFSGCKSEAPPPEQPKAETPAVSKVETPAPEAAKPAETASSPEPAASASATAPKSSYDRALLRVAALRDKAPDTYVVKFTTTRGDFDVTVHREWAPLGADRFYTLVKHHFYDNASFFRVVPGFVVQFGLSAYPPVSAAWTNAKLKDDPVTQSNKRGYLTFATAGPNTRTTQVFINLKENARLDGMGFAPFGVVEGKGMNVVEMLYDQYGDNAGPDQTQIEAQGKPYLDKGWPKLDSIKTATLAAAKP